MILITEFLLGIIGAFIGVTSLVVSYYLNKRIMEQTDRNLKTQLLYQDTKQALANLQKIIDESNYYNLKQNVSSFLNSFEGNYIPNEVSQNLYNEFEKLKKYYNTKNPYPQDEMSDEEYNHNYEMAKRIHMDQYENFEYDLDKEVDSFKHSVKNIIKNACTTT